MGSCLPWLLITSFVILGFAGGLTTSWAYFEFPTNVNSSVIPPENMTYIEYGDTRYTDEYREYVDGTRKNSNYFGDCRLYVVIPSGVNALVSAVLVMACFVSRKVISTTAVLHSATCLWVVNMAVTVWFQYAAKDMIYGHDDFKETFFWILGIHVGQLLLLTIQVLMAGFVLHQEKIPCFSINFSHLFTISTVVLAGRMTLGVFSLIMFFNSAFIRGMVNRRESFDRWNFPKVRFPEEYVFTSVVILVYGAVACAESLLSLLLGKVHAAVMGATGLLSGIGYCYVSIIASPSVMTIITGHDTYYTQFIMTFTLGGGLLSLIHGIITLIQPKRMVSPVNIPSVLEKTFSIENAFQRHVNHALAAPSPHGNMLAGIENIVAVRSGISDWIIALLSLLSLILASVGAGNIPWPHWMGYVLIGSNMSVLCRILPSILTKQEEKTSAFKTLIITILEGVPSLVGAIGGWCSNNGPTITAGVLTFLIVLFQVKILLSRIKVDVSFKNDERPLLQNEEGQVEQSQEETASVPVV